MIDRIQKARQVCEAACEKLGRPIHVMEVCGTHTVSLFRHGIRSILPGNLKLISGPGCPVCVTEQGYIDVVLQLADRDDCLIATYGDMLRVPGKAGSLETRQAKNNVSVVLSSEDALQLAMDRPDKTVVFVAVGFETTAPATAVVIQEAAEKSIDNFCILPGHKRVVPAMRALLSGKNNQIDAFLCPGHVSVIIGFGAFGEIVRDFNKPCVVAGFEPVQILEGLAEIARELQAGKPQLKSMYHAVVTEQGNPAAQKLIEQYFESTAGPWRGLGEIPDGTLRLRERYKRFDAFERFGIAQVVSEEMPGCRCGEVLCGLIDPAACSLFGSACTPEKPVGACMVSSEGTCAAWYKYGRKEQIG